MQNSSETIEKIFQALPSLSPQHSAQTAIYQLLDNMASSHIKALFAGRNPTQINFGPFGALIFPYRQMGAIDSLDLFGLDELILFSFYWANRHQYKRALDIGANIGLHSILMSKAGLEVDSYEPDITHFQMLQENVHLNNASTVRLHNSAISNKSGEAQFIRVLGNTTSSHLAGSKNAYGELEKYTVKVQDIGAVISGIDLIKMDVEGHEAEILLALSKDQFQNVDILVEIGSPQNAQRIFSHLTSLGINMFAQKKGWGKINKLEEMPTSYKDGTLFISSKSSMPWNVK
jgi:FkbM family methyltransferase